MTKGINTMPNGTARIVKANYYKQSARNILDFSFEGGAFKATGVLVIDEDILNRSGKRQV